MKKPVLRKRNEGGFTIVAFALMIFTMLGFAGLAVDVGYLQLEKRKLQAAADAGAMGALREMEKGNTDLVVAGQNDAALNGFTDGQNNTTVTISNPPTSGTYNGQTTAVSATVTRVVPTFFMRVLGTSNVTISATAVAQTSTAQGSIGGCIFAMDSSVSNAFWVHGTPVLSTACGVVVNSNNAQAFVMDGTSQILLANGAEIGVVGLGTTGSGWSLNGNPSIKNTTTGQAESPVNIPSFGDPLASVSAPTLGTLTVQSSSYMSVKPNQTVTLNPGIYCGGLDLKGTVTFNTGVYIIAGGGLTIDSGAVVTDTGTGEMFYNTSERSQGHVWGCPGSSSAGGFTFNGHANINLMGLTVPDTNSANGQIGMLFFEDRSVSGLSHTINGSSTSTFDGAMYFLNSSLYFVGTNKTPGFLYIVADTIEIGGNSNLGNDKSALANVNTLAPSATGGGLVQ